MKAPRAAGQRSFALALVALLWPAAARAQDVQGGGGGGGAGGCGAGVRAWAEACGREAHRTVTAEACPGGRVVFRVEVPGRPPLGVEVARAQGQVFRRAGAWGLSPVGDFPDWGSEPESVRSGLDALAACVARDESLAREDATVAAPPVSPPPRAPWLVLFALGCIAGLAALRVRGLRALGRAGAGRAVKNAWATATGLFALGGVTWAWERALAAPAFFHQNGQGPLWIAFALGERSNYGPGYAEVFGARALATMPTPEAGVFALQALLCATVPVSAWMLARHAGAPRAVAWAAAVALGASPVLARIAQSQSYFATCAALLFAAAAVLAAGARPLRVKSPGFSLGVVGAGALVAQAARVHPMCWLPAALLPAVLLLGPGRARRRIVASLGAAAGIALVVLATSGGVLLEVLRGTLGEQWAHAGVVRGAQWGGAFVLPWLVAGGALVVLARTRTRARAALALGIGLATALIARKTSQVASDLICTPQAYALWFAPVAGTAAAALVGTAVRAGRWRWPSRAAAVLVLALGAVAFVRYRPALEIRTTDLLEQEFAREFRARLPPGARVAFLSRAGHRVLALPLYIAGESYERGAVLPLRADESPRALREPGARWYYYHSSLCSTPEAGEFCARMEAGLALEPVDARTLPAAPGVTGVRYRWPSVRVGLYRVLAR